jgi:LysR family transcriptional activator of mexEF-oprN operon
MARARDSYERDLDLNLLRVFVVVAEAGSVTEAASRLYVTQPAVSAALRRLQNAIGAPLFARAGRGLVLTTRGEHLLADVRPHLAALALAAVSPATFDPKTSDRVVRVGLSDVNEAWLLPPLLSALGREAPGLTIVVLTVQFRTVGKALSSGEIDLAVTVSDELPKDIVREPLFVGHFVCLCDSREVRLPKKLTLEGYLSHEHAIVSYNGDLRGIVEDLLGHERRVRVSVPSFHSIPSVIDGTRLLATVPAMVARQLIARHPHFRALALPFSLGATPMELLHRRATEGDPALAFVRRHIVSIARDAAKRARVTSVAH